MAGHQLKILGKIAA